MNFTIRQVLGFSIAVWLAFFIASALIPPISLFHFFNPISIAMGIVVMVVYWPAVWEAIRAPNHGITLAHVLTIGIVLNWAGFIIRMGRWFFTGEHPSVIHPMDFWVYNFGLWMSVWAGLFLIGAAQLAVEKKRQTGTLIVIFLIAWGFLTYLSSNDIGFHP